MRTIVHQAEKFLIQEQIFSIQIFLFEKQDISIKNLCFQRITFPENMLQMFDCLVLTYIGNLLPGIF